MVVKSKVFTLGLMLAGSMLAGAVSATEKPLQLAQISEGFDAAKTYTQSCFACHNSGAAGAPKVGDAEDWTARMEKGMDAVVQNAINGLNGVMPAKGLCFTCTDDELKAIVEYMVEQSIPQ